MYERLLDKNSPPSMEEIKNHLGVKGDRLFTYFEARMNHCYTLTREMKFPFGSSYGWGYQYRHRTTHLCYAFFEAEAFTILLQLGDHCADRVCGVLPNCSAKTVDLWKNRYPCGERGGWIHYRILEENDLNDVMELIHIKKKPLNLKEY